jgi:hypothetical protein
LSDLEKKTLQGQGRWGRSWREEDLTSPSMCITHIFIEKLLCHCTYNNCMAGIGRKEKPMPEFSLQITAKNSKRVRGRYLRQIAALRSLVRAAHNADRGASRHDGGLCLG